MTVPPRKRWFEDYCPDEIFEFGNVAVSEADIIAFAWQFDPQPFHVNPEAAARSPFGGLIASGWHTCALMMRMMTDHFIPPQASLGSPGLDEIRWTKPVRPGDCLRVRLTVTGCRRSENRTGIGTVDQAVEVLNQRDEVVMTCRGRGVYRCRPDSL